MPIKSETLNIAHTAYDIPILLGDHASTCLHINSTIAKFVLAARNLVLIRLYFRIVYIRMLHSTLLRLTIILRRLLVLFDSLRCCTTTCLQVVEF